MRSILTSILCSLLISLSACGGGGDGPTGPRQPEDSRLLLISFTLQNADNASTLQEARLLLDSRIVGIYRGDAVSVVDLGGVALGVPTGNHTLSVVVDRQTQSPSRYSMGKLNPGSLPNMIFVQSDQGPVAFLSLPRETVSLQTGEVYRVTVNIP
jgi:hypothetical protein